MKSIRISDEVWSVICNQGVFGENPDDVLKRLLGIPAPVELINKDRNTMFIAPNTNKRASYNRSSNMSKYRLNSSIQHGVLTVSLTNGARRDFILPEKNDKEQIREIRDQAGKFAEDNLATKGQVNAVYKTLTDNGYFVSLKK